MLKKIKEGFLNVITSRLLLLYVVFILMGVALVYRLFYLQIINGQSYLDNFQLKIQKEKIIKGTRGNIYDRNGNLLAYNELSYSVVIEDVYSSGSNRNKALNATLYKLIKMIEKNGDSVVSDFNIILNNNNEYEYKLTGTKQKRFLADIYGRATIDKLLYSEETATPDEAMLYLCNKYKIGEYEESVDENGKTISTFKPGKGFSKTEQLQMVTLRYQISLYGFQKYISTTIANNVSKETVAIIMENISELDGVSIEESTIRKYNYPYYFSHIIGYTGQIDSEELIEYSSIDDSYNLNDTVGKSGIEEYMELELQGKKGSAKIYVDNMGRILDTTDIVDSKAGNDVYLTIDKDLQVAVYNIIEQKLAGILISKLSNISFEQASNLSSGNKRISIDEVYYALINNSAIDTKHFASEDASETEKNVYKIYSEKKSKVLGTLKDELKVNKTPYNKLPKEYENYQSYIVNMLMDNGVLVSSLVDREDSVYVAWAKDEVISLREYLDYAIAQNWIDITRLKLNTQYASSEELIDALMVFIEDKLSNDVNFDKWIYRYLIANHTITGKQICTILYEQDLISVTENEIKAVQNGNVSTYDFMCEMISTLQITPAQLALDPCTGSCVVTDVNTGEVLALVSYPGYDINKLANGVDTAYYNRLQADLSLPQWNHATQEKTAPGSTFKVVSSVAAIEEGVVSSLGETIYCSGTYEKMAPTIHHCWIYPKGSHGAMNISKAIANSCNGFFYEVGFRLAQTGKGFDAEYGLNRLEKYADWFGLTEKSGIEILESEPKFSDELPVPSAIGQGTHNYTTVGLARYVTAVANNGTVYNLSLLDKLTDPDGTVITDYTPEVRNQIEISDNLWEAIHAGMRQVVTSKAYFNELPVHVAGKTGTAQQDLTRANHALFISYAPYENPEIAVSIRIAYGYESSYAAQTAKDVYKYYYSKTDNEEIVTGTADVPDDSLNSGD